MAQTLLQRVKSHTRGQNTSGQNTLALTVETIEHGFEHDDFTPLVCLAYQSQSRQAALVRDIAKRVTNGFHFVKRDKADFGHVFAKQKDTNQGLVRPEMVILKGLVRDKKSIQSADVLTWVHPSKVTNAFEARDAEKLEKSALTWKKSHTSAELQQKIIDADRTLKAYMKALNDKSVEAKAA